MRDVVFEVEIRVSFELWNRVLPGKNEEFGPALVGICPTTLR